MSQKFIPIVLNNISEINDLDNGVMSIDTKSEKIYLEMNNDINCYTGLHKDEAEALIDRKLNEYNKLEKLWYYLDDSNNISLEVLAPETIKVNHEATFIYNLKYKNNVIDNIDVEITHNEDDYNDFTVDYNNHMIKVIPKYAGEKILTITISMDVSGVKNMQFIVDYDVDYDYQIKAELLDNSEYFSSLDDEIICKFKGRLFSIGNKNFVPYEIAKPLPIENISIELNHGSYEIEYNEKDSNFGTIKITPEKLEDIVITLKASKDDLEDTQTITIPYHIIYLKIIAPEKIYYKESNIFRFIAQNQHIDLNLNEYILKIKKDDEEDYTILSNNDIKRNNTFTVTPQSYIDSKVDIVLESNIPDFENRSINPIYEVRTVVLKNLECELDANDLVIRPDALTSTFKVLYHSEIEHDPDSKDIRSLIADEEFKLRYYYNNNRDNIIDITTNTSIVDYNSETGIGSITLPVIDSFITNITLMLDISVDKNIIREHKEVNIKVKDPYVSNPHIILELETPLNNLTDEPIFNVNLSENKYICQYNFRAIYIPDNDEDDDTAIVLNKDDLEIQIVAFPNTYSYPEENPNPEYNEIVDYTVNINYNNDGRYSNEKHMSTINIKPIPITSIYDRKLCVTITARKNDIEEIIDNNNVQLLYYADPGLEINITDIIGFSGNTYNNISYPCFFEVQSRYYYNIQDDRYPAGFLTEDEINITVQYDDNEEFIHERNIITKTYTYPREYLQRYVDYKAIEYKFIPNRNCKLIVNITAHKNLLGMDFTLNNLKEYEFNNYYVNINGSDKLNSNNQGYPTLVYNITAKPGETISLPFICRTNNIDDNTQLYISNYNSFYIKSVEIDRDESILTFTIDDENSNYLYQQYANKQFTRISLTYNAISIYIDITCAEYKLDIRINAPTEMIQSGTKIASFPYLANYTIMASPNTELTLPYIAEYTIDDITYTIGKEYLYISLFNTDNPVTIDDVNKTITFTVPDHDTFIIIKCIAFNKSYTIVPITVDTSNNIIQFELTDHVDALSEYNFTFTMSKKLENLDYKFKYYYYELNRKEIPSNVIYERVKFESSESELEGSMTYSIVPNISEAIVMLQISGYDENGEKVNGYAYTLLCQSPIVEVNYNSLKMGEIKISTDNSISQYYYQLQLDINTTVSKVYTADVSGETVIKATFINEANAKFVIFSQILPYRGYIYNSRDWRLNGSPGSECKRAFINVPTANTGILKTGTLIITVRSRHDSRTTIKDIVYNVSYYEYSDDTIINELTKPTKIEVIDRPSNYVETDENTPTEPWWDNTLSYWQQIQSNVRNGFGEQLYPIGTILYTKWYDNIIQKYIDVNCKVISHKKVDNKPALHLQLIGEFPTVTFDTYNALSNNTNPTVYYYDNDVDQENIYTRDNYTYSDERGLYDFYDQFSESVVSGTRTNKEYYNTYPVLTGIQQPNSPAIMNLDMKNNIYQNAKKVGITFKNSFARYSTSLIREWLTSNEVLWTSRAIDYSTQNKPQFTMRHGFKLGFRYDDFLSVISSNKIDSRYVSLPIVNKVIFYDSPQYNTTIRSYSNKSEIYEILLDGAIEVFHEELEDQFYLPSVTDLHQSYSDNDIRQYNNCIYNNEFHIKEKVGRNIIVQETPNTITQPLDPEGYYYEPTLYSKEIYYENCIGSDSNTYPPEITQLQDSIYSIRAITKPINNGYDIVDPTGNTSPYNSDIDTDTLTRDQFVTMIGEELPFRELIDRFDDINHEESASYSNEYVYYNGNKTSCTDVITKFTPCCVIY